MALYLELHPEPRWEACRVPEALRPDVLPVLEQHSELLLEV
ncbi:hypothetical protein [Bradyrhizobium prioriisuperbiae]|nr:hypothetical protein [Bradyrhizobium prioritasuperba]